MKSQVIHKVANLNHPVVLEQAGQNSFNVVYGNQIKTGLNYAQAAMEYGSCIMHSAVCAGRIMT